MRVLHVIPAIASRYGGPSKVVLDTCKALRQQGVDAEIATTNADGRNNLRIPERSPAIVEGVPVYFFERQFRSRYKFSRDLTVWLKRNVPNYDLLHIHAVFSYSTAAAAFYARKYSVPYIMLPHGMLAPWPIRKNWLIKKIYLRAIELKNLGCATAVHFTAEDELQMSLAGGRSNFVLPCIVDFPKQNGNHRNRTNGVRLRILFLSRIDPKKGIDVLISALSTLIKKGREFEFVIAGSGDKRYEDQVKTMIAVSSLGSCTKFRGFVEGAEKAALLEAADIFVLPSHDENFGLAVVEAMANGLPVIITNRVNIHRDIEQGGAGLVVSPTADDLRAAIESLMDNPVARAAMGKRAVEVVNQKFSLNRLAREQVQIYRDIVDASHTSSSWRLSPQHAGGQNNASAKRNAQKC